LSQQPANDTGCASECAEASTFNIYIVEGDPNRLQDLRRAGLHKAYSCVVISDRSSIQVVDEETVDEGVVHVFLSLEKSRLRARDSGRLVPLNYSIEVLSTATLKLLDQTYKNFKGGITKRNQRGNLFRSVSGG
jgi:hypothetical protein